MNDYNYMDYSQWFLNSLFQNENGFQKHSSENPKVSALS